MALSLSFSYLADLATIVSCIVAIITMMYTIKVFHKASRIQESVGTNNAESLLNTLNSLNNYLSELCVHSEDGLQEIHLIRLEQKAQDVVEQVDRHRLYFSDNALKAQDKLVAVLKECIIYRCQQWPEAHIDNTSARIDEYLRKILENDAAKVKDLIEKIIMEVRLSKTV